MDRFTDELKNKALEWKDVAQSREELTELLLPVEPEVADNYNDLTYECNPEGSGCHWAALESLLKVPCRRIREDSAWANVVRSSSSRNHDADGTDDLSKRKRGADVQT